MEFRLRSPKPKNKKMSLMKKRARGRKARHVRICTRIEVKRVSPSKKKKEEMQGGKQAREWTREKGNRDGRSQYQTTQGAAKKGVFRIVPGPRGSGVQGVAEQPGEQKNWPRTNQKGMTKEEFEHQLLQEATG